MNRYLILGGGIAGFTAAEKIRELEPEASVVMVCGENGIPYKRPLLSKIYLHTLKKDHLPIREAEWYEEKKIRLIIGRKVKELCLEERLAKLEDGTELSYDRCIYALGAFPFVPPFGNICPGVFPVRTLEDLYGIHRYAAIAENAVVIGGGVIGLEIGSELQNLGLKLTVLEAGPRIMGRLMDAASAAVLKKRLTDREITVREAVKISRMTSDPETGRVTGVELSDGQWFPGEVVVVACGVRADAAVARAAGLVCDRGVCVDETMVTSDPAVYAAGDCIQCKGPNPSLWNYSQLSALAAAENAVRSLWAEKGQKEADGEPRRFSMPVCDVILSCFDTPLLSTGSAAEGDGITTICRQMAEGGVLTVREVGADGTFTRTESFAPDETASQPVLAGTESGKAPAEGEKKVSAFPPVSARYQVNPHTGGGLPYEKYFYREEKLVGAILIGDLSKMNAVKKEMEGEAT